MKKITFLFITALAMTVNANAQAVWKMVITHNDGIQQSIAVSDVKDVTFISETLKNQNEDQIIIKELYVGGCPMDEGTNYFQKDKGFILYNNCGEQAVVNNLAIAFSDPFNGHAPSNTWNSDGKLIYEDEEYIPAANGIWYFQEPLVLKPYAQIVVSCMGAINNTTTYSQSVNYANGAYYTMYDPEAGYNNPTWYPTPSDIIPTSHYMKAVEFGQGNAWTLSNNSPAFFIFHTTDVTPAEYANNPDNYIYAPGKQQNAINRCLKIKKDWIIDGIEVFQADKVSESKKRLTVDIDGGYIPMTNKLGHTLYRNVNKAKTESLPENQGKLVYNYQLGNDPSQIDAEASIKAGCHIVYIDYDNSETDFHERQKFSIRGE